MRAVDGPLADDLEAVCEITASALLKLAAIVYFTPIFLWPGLAFGIVSYILGTIYIAAQLSIKRSVSFTSFVEQTTDIARRFAGK